MFATGWGRGGGQLEEQSLTHCPLNTREKKTDGAAREERGGAGKGGSFKRPIPWASLTWRPPEFQHFKARKKSKKIIIMKD